MNKYLAIAIIAICLTAIVLALIFTGNILLLQQIGSVVKDGIWIVAMLILFLVMILFL